MKAILSLLLSSFFLLSCGGGGSSSPSEPDAPDFRITNVGRSPLALTSPSFACEDFIRSLDELQSLHIAFLYHTFGNDLTCLNRLLGDSRLESLVMHLVNEPGHRNRRLGSYEFLANISSPQEYDRLIRSQSPSLKQDFIAYSQGAIAIANSIPDSTQCIISPGLESNLSNEASRILIQWTREIFPSHCRVMWNPLREREVISVGMVDADLVEAHGRNPLVSAPCTVNTDGTDISFPERPTFAQSGWYISSGEDLQNYILRYSAQCEIVFLWVFEDNCIRQGSFVDPRQRDCSIGQRSGINHLLADEIVRITK